MQHLVLTGDPASDDELIARAARVLRSDGLVAFPTETVYGLGGLARSEVAVRRIFEAKGRPSTDPLIVHVAPDWPLDEVVATADPLVDRLRRTWWPGPLTLVVPKHPSIPDLVTAGLDTVAVRAPAHPIARALLAATGQPVAAPSANRFSYVSATTAQHVIDDLGDACDVVLDAGPATAGIESTVVAVADDRLTVLRHGAIPVDELRSVLGDDVHILDGTGPSPTVPDDAPASSPGRLVRHYSPTTETLACEPGFVPERPDGSVCFLGYADRPVVLPPGWTLRVLGRLDDLGEVARVLYSVLREIDRAGHDTIVIELTGLAVGLGRALDDRIRRAASGRVLGPVRS